MSKNFSYYLKALKYKFLEKLGYSSLDLKEQQEEDFWRQVLHKYIDWYNGKIGILYATESPTESQKVKLSTDKDSALITWFELHQKARYLQDLSLDKNVFAGQTILDVGSGPFPGGLAFDDCVIYCLDPLLPKYMSAGFPLHYYDRARFIHAYSESIPLPENYIDGVISINAIDHVGDLLKTSQELSRVCKPNCKFAMHVHYHAPSTTEPISLNDQLFRHTFSWVSNLQKIKESKAKFDHVVSDNESYVLWRNF
ncbi:MAG: methyltransferase domain-containing protein [Cyclobacteriaceae bacterium]